MNKSILGKERKWDLRFLNMAESVAKWSKDPSTKVGSVVVSEDRTQVFLGYNGLPKQFEDDERELLADREKKYELIIHGEINAVLFANRDLHDYTLYTWPFLPCSRCSSIVTQKGISRVVSYKNTVDRWKDSIELGKWMFRKCGVLITEY